MFGTFMLLFFQAVVGIILGRLFYSLCKYAYTKYRDYKRRREARAQTVVSARGEVWESRTNPTTGEVVVRPKVTPNLVIKSNTNKVLKPSASIKNLDEIF